MFNKVNAILGFCSFFMFIFFSNCVSADIGCALNYGNSNSEIIYFTVIGTAGNGNWTNYGGSPTYNNVGFPTACPRYDYDTALDAGGRCCVNGNCNNSTRTRVNFTPIPCPIDDNAAYLFPCVIILVLMNVRQPQMISSLYS